MVTRDPEVSVIIASDRVGTLLPGCLRSLEAESSSGGAPPFEAVVASGEEPAAAGFGFPVRWVPVSERNPAFRRNRAAAAAVGRILAFLDDDATAEPGWLSAGAAAIAAADVAGGPDPGPRDAPYGERLADLLLATPGIGSGIPAHGWNPRGGPVRSAHDIALCNLFVRRDLFLRLGGFEESFGYVGEDTDFVSRALDAGARVVLEPAARVRHRRRRFPGPYVAQRWRYRVKTGRLLVERPGLHARGRVAAFLAAGFFGTGGVALFGWRFLLPAAALYAVVTWAASVPIWRKDPALFPAVPFAFAVHHLTYFTGLLAGMARGLIAVAAR
jgi:glycosyltransferase involved in cell wall biosynthesis